MVHHTNRMFHGAAPLTALLLVACATGGTPGESTAQLTPTGGDPSRTASTAPPDGGSIGDMDQAMLEAVVEQASEETDVSTQDIEVVTAEAVTWSDGSIGCPQEGMGYTQALVPGFRVVLNVAGDEIHYHAGSDGRFFACDDPQEPIDDGTVDR